MDFKSVYEECKGDTAYNQVKKLGVVLLAQHASADEACPGDVVYTEYCRSLDGVASVDERIPKTTFVQYLSRASREGGTDILCDGRRQGYYTRKETKVEPEADLPYAVDERDLYPLFVDWLVQNGYAAQCVATSRSNGQWGNPDVVGLKVFEGIGTFESEVVTIECKKTFDNWKHWIFEAVSHTRFSDRSYFAFTFPEDEIDKQSAELVKYAEYFGVGILVLEVTSIAYEQLKNGKEIPVDGDSIRVLVHANRNRPLTEDKISFLKSVGVDSMQKLCQFGRGVDQMKVGLTGAKLEGELL